MTKTLVKSICEGLQARGVKDVISCPGGRSAALLNEFVESQNFKIETFYDERTAGFYALGKAQSTQRPVVVLTTSGSAVAGLYPSALEAAHQKNAPLILLTADRPQNFTNTGAPQTINQKNFFSLNHIKSLEPRLDTDWSKIEFPIHINVPLGEPSPLKVSEDTREWGDLVIVGSLESEDHSEVLSMLQDYRGALVLEPLSNLSLDEKSSAHLIRHPEVFLNKVGLAPFRRVIRLGGVPVLKAWREISNHPQANYWSAYPFSGGPGVNPLSAQEILETLKESPASPESFVVEEQSLSKKINQLIEEHPQSEVSILKKISKCIPQGAQVFIGNSLPIREWAYADHQKFINKGQRGVNGIDGTLALALGSLSSEKENWIILGDLTTLYNMNDFQALRHLEGYKVKILVINNQGGQIFSRLFKKNQSYFVNSQDISIKKLAELWGLSYVVGFEKLQQDQEMAEIVIEPQQSEKFWKDIDGLRP